MNKYIDSLVADKNVVALYQYGSRVYGTYSAKSDYDYIAIVKNKTSEQYSDNLININFFTIDEHIDRIDNHEISALETLFLDSKFVLKEDRKFIFKLDLSKLRHSLSQKASNSFVKAKKKLTVEKDYDLMLGKKSLFHSFRIINYGIQIAKTGKIYDYGSCNELFKEIIRYYDDWQNLFDRYKSYHNAIMTEFRQYAHK